MINVNGLTKVFKGKNRALNNVSFDVHANELIVVNGKNGCGKSTLLGILSGLLPFSIGEVRVLGSIPKKNLNTNLVGFLPSESFIIDYLKVVEYLDFCTKFRKRDRSSSLLEINQLLTLFGLDKYRDTSIGSLSTGNKKKAALISILFFDPPVLLLDEPFSNLDEDSNDVLCNILNKRVSSTSDKVTLLSTHNSVLKDLKTSRIMQLENGKIDYFE